MFWGLVLEPGKRYSQQVGKAFHISMATLEITNGTENDLVPVMLEYQDGKEYLLCTLNKVKCYQCPLDLNFKEGEKIGFYSAVGRAKVHLTGYLLEEFDSDMLSEEEEDEDEEEMVSENTGKKRKESFGMKAGGKKIKLTEAFDEIEEEEDEEDSDYEAAIGDDDNDITEEAEDEEEDEDDEEDDEDDEEEDSDELDTPKVKTGKPQQVKTPNEKKGGKGPDNKKEAGKTPIKEQNGQVQTPGSQKKNKKQGETPKQGTPQKSFNKDGVDIVETVTGRGPVAKPGSKVVVYYTGRLKQNNRQFDSTTSGAGFKFTLGRNEVIKGWDIGVVGMHVGGKRTITIPPQLAYGKKGQLPVIPPNSTLVFDIELKNVY